MKTIDLQCCNKPLVKERGGYSSKYRTWHLELRCGVCGTRFGFGAYSYDGEFDINFIKKDVEN